MKHVSMKRVSILMSAIPVSITVQSNTTVTIMILISSAAIPLGITIAHVRQLISLVATKSVTQLSVAMDLSITQRVTIVLMLTSVLLVRTTAQKNCIVSTLLANTSVCLVQLVLSLVTMELLVKTLMSVKSAMGIKPSTVKPVLALTWKEAMNASVILV